MEAVPHAGEVLAAASADDDIRSAHDLDAIVTNFKKTKAC